MKKKLTVLVAGLLIVLIALPAAAHVTVAPDNPEPGGFAVYTVRVPNESDTASTVRVEVDIPTDLQASRYQPHDGWTIAWEDDRLVIEGGAIAPGEFEEFRFQARNPEEATTLAFPAVQVYDDGEAVNWTGEPGSDAPASQVDIGAGEEEGVGVPVIVALVLGGLGTLLGAVALVRRS